MNKQWWIFAAWWISTTLIDTEVNNCFSIYHSSWITCEPKSNFICDIIPTKAILFFFGLEVNSTWLITSELANQRAWKALFQSFAATIIHKTMLIAGGFKRSCHVAYTISGAGIERHKGMRKRSNLYPTHCEKSKLLIVKSVLQLLQVNYLVPAWSCTPTQHNAVGCPHRSQMNRR